MYIFALKVEYLVLIFILFLIDVLYDFIYITKLYF